jgi:hypothetical protein
MSIAKAIYFLSSRDARERDDRPESASPVELLRSRLREQRLFPLSSVTAIAKTSPETALSAVKELMSNGEAVIVDRSDRADEKYLSLPSPSIAS